MEVRQITPNDHEAVIVIKGEWDREDLKNILDDLFSTTRREVLESVIELVGDEKEKAEFGSTNHEVYIQVGINEERKRLKTTLSSLQSLKDK